MRSFIIARFDLVRGIVQVYSIHRKFAFPQIEDESRAMLANTTSIGAACLVSRPIPVFLQKPLRRIHPLPTCQPLFGAARSTPCQPSCIPPSRYHTHTRNAFPVTNFNRGGYQSHCTKKKPAPRLFRDLGAGLSCPQLTAL